MKTHIEVKPTGGVQFEVTARGHRIISDQPAENGGEDTGMTPPELMLASLGTCAAYYATEYLRTRKLDACSLRIQVGAEKAQKPARLSDFRIVIDAPAVADNETHREGILRAVQSCLIHNTLLHSPHVETVLTQDPHELRTGSEPTGTAHAPVETGLTALRKRRRLQRPIVGLVCLIAFCFLAVASPLAAQTAHSGATVQVGSGFDSPFGVAVDGSGNVFVAGSAVKEIVAVNGVVSSSSTVQRCQLTSDLGASVRRNNSQYP